ncbi:HAMP domain-containing sensor histidine kinase [Methylomonas sp. EFPC3]|uniref:sensor histidine kinase n=1 Tax=Methylomonas sp. EFPC3 TaxID=3021710 RepID=UPI0024161451|nr:HAMP domain-containing sensor histidine kinase [Methylomonas sp. EFPC3]WFP48662.1 HAMP domain-containing sensor histidine kinase [Methylomonas sp. EFPC3]
MYPTMRRLLFRPVIFVSFVLGLLVIAELLAIGRLTWVNDQRIHIIERDIGRGHHLEDTLFELLQLQLTLSTNQSASEAEKSQLADIQEQLIGGLNDYDSAIPANLQQLQEVFGKAVQGDQANLVTALQLIKQVLDRQAQEEERLLINIEDDGELEMQLAILLPLLLLWIVGYFFRTNVLEPLDCLKELLSGLAEGEMKPIKRSTSDPLLHALFDRYNHLVSRLVELEREHLEHTELLEYRVRQTSHALLERSQQLAKAERLAALAELAASTAHELRNPLASIQLAMENMLEECRDSDLAERLQMVYREVQRLTRNLNDLLASARSNGETSQRVAVQPLLEELLTLLKYQARENVSFNCRVAEELYVFLPESEFRQAVLNLLLNAVQAIGASNGEVNVNADILDGKLELTVVDSGPGFSADFLRHGIRPFVSLKDGGSGLGLAMVRRFVKDHQGGMRLQNDEQGHACVTLTFPLAA